MKRLAIIPARSGSKGIKDKNIKLMMGKPLMGYTIIAALESDCFDEVMVSTDSEYYAQIAQEYGASVPFLRSDLTSSDVASSWDTVREVLRNYEERGIIFDNLCLLQPTSPLRTSTNIKLAYELFNAKNAISVASVCIAEHSPLWCGKLDASLSMDGFIRSEHMNSRQENGIFYRLNGAIYICDIEYFKESGFAYNNGCFAYIMDERTSIDIDTDLDFEFAEFLMRENKGV